MAMDRLCTGRLRKKVRNRRSLVMAGQRLGDIMGYLGDMNFRKKYF